MFLYLVVTLTLVTVTDHSEFSIISISFGNSKRAGIMVYIIVNQRYLFTTEMRNGVKQIVKHTCLATQTESAQQST